DKSPSKSLARLASTDDSMVESTDDDVDSSDVDAGAKADKEAANLEELSKRTKMMMADFKKPILRPVDSIRIDVTQANAVLEVPEQRATISEGVQRLDSAPVRMGINGHKMFVLTQTGHLSTWDIDKIKAILSRQSITDCVVKG
ncbi:hypothetical protein TELCIR_21480, partial [Teladorsagia circumcincta]